MSTQIGPGMTPAHTAGEHAGENDLLSGAKQIGGFLGCNERRAYYLCETGQIPAFKLGDRWYARKSRLLEHFRKLEDGAAA